MTEEKEEKDPQEENADDAQDQDAAPEEEGDSEGSENEEDEQEQKGNNSKKILLFVVLPLLILAGVGGGLYFFGFLDFLLGADKTQGQKQETEEQDTETAFIEIPTMIVNLNTGDGTPRYLRLSVQLEISDADKAAAIRAVIPRVVDQFQTYLRELRVEDLRGSAGIYRLQMELLWRVNQAAAPHKVKDVLFQEILIQ